MTRSLTVRLNRPQADVFRHIGPGVLIAMVFGRGVGKSFTQRRAWYKLIAEWDGKRRPGGPADLRGVRIILLMPSFKQAVDTYAQALVAELEGQWAFLGGTINRTRWRIEFPGGSWIQFFGAENVDSARGMRCDVVSADECDDIDPSAFEAVAVPWLSEPWSLKIRLASGTPRRGRFGLLYKLYRQGQELDDAGHRLYPLCHGFHATYQQAPRQVSAEFVTQVRGTMLPQVFEREWMASFDSGEGLVYPFDERVHVRKAPDLKEFSEILIGVDWGWEDPGVYLVAGVRGNGRDAEVHFFREIYRQHKVESWWMEQARALHQEFPKADWYADKSQPARIQSMKMDVGMFIRADASKAIEDGIDCVADRMVARVKSDGTQYVRLFVDPSCRNTIREFLTYRRKRDAKDKERVLDKVEDLNNHAMDAARYLCFGRFGKPPAARGVMTSPIL